MAINCNRLPSIRGLCKFVVVFVLCLDQHGAHVSPVFTSSNSDIWRDYPALIRTLFSYIYLNNRQGAQTSIAAAVGDFSSTTDSLYLQPYRQLNSDTIAFPIFEMLGPFVGHVVTKPRLRSHDYHQAAQALWTAMEELLKQESSVPCIQPQGEEPILTSLVNENDEL